jgi:hypothetical protein
MVYSLGKSERDPYNKGKFSPGPAEYDIPRKVY